MSLSGLPPAGGAHRIASAYGVTPRRVSPPAAPVAEPADGGVRAATPGGIPLSAVLNAEERAYFDQIEAMGPITYGPSRRAGMVPDAPRGLRLDVRG